MKDRGLDQGRLDEMAERVINELGPAFVLRGVDAALGQPESQLVRVSRPEALLLERVDELEAAPGGLQVDLVAAVGDPCAGRRVAGHGFN